MSEKAKLYHFLVSIKTELTTLVPEVIEDAIDKYIGTHNIKMINVEDHTWSEDKK